MAGTILPQAVETFVDANGKPLAGGSVYMYIPNTTTFKNTWQDPALTILNTNPIILNASGQAIIWGTGSYRQQVFDVNGNLIWDQVTEDTSSGLLGNMTDDTFTSGSGFTPGTTTALTLTVAPGSIQNTWIYFDGIYQADNSIASLVGTTLTFSSPIPVGVQLVTVKIGSTIAIGTPSDGTVTDASVASNAAIQSSKLSFLQAGAGAVVRTVQSKLREWISPFDFNAVGDGVTIDDAAINAAATEAVATGKALYLSGKFAVTQITLPSGLRHVMGDCLLLGQTSGTYSSVLEIKNITDLTISGTILVSGQYNTGYSCGVKVWANQPSGCSLLSLNNVSIAGCKVGWQFGDPTQVDTLVSEITVSGGYTYGCPIACSAYGTQTFIDFQGYILESSYGSGTGAWTALPSRCVQALGASITQTGGEMLMTVTTSGAGVELDPITSISFTNNYGTYKGNGVIVECASPFVVTGAAGVASPVNGLISFIGCTGIHTQNLQALIQTDANFTGDIICQSNEFYCTVARTFSNIACSGNANVWCDDKSFGANFLGPLSGISGGIPHFTKRTVLRASNLGGQSFPTATNTDMKFTVLDNTGDLARFSSSYGLATGIFTVPAGGLKDVEIYTRIYFSGLGSTALYIEINNVIMSVDPSPANGGGTFYNAGNLSAGTQIKATLNNGGGSIAVGSNPWDFMQITARN